MLLEAYAYATDHFQFFVERKVQRHYLEIELWIDKVHRASADHEDCQHVLGYNFDLAIAHLSFLLAGRFLRLDLLLLHLLLQMSKFGRWLACGLLSALGHADLPWFNPIEAETGWIQ